MKYRTILGILVVSLLIFPCTTVMAADFSYTFTTLTQETIGTVPTDVTSVSPSFSFDITNSTGQKWTNFEAEIPLTGEAQPYFTSYTGAGTGTITGYTGSGSYTPSYLTITGLSIASGSDYDFSVGTDNPGETGGWVFLGTPTVSSGPPIPIPPTVLLLGSGLLGLGAWRRFRKD